MGMSIADGAWLRKSHSGGVDSFPVPRDTFAGMEPDTTKEDILIRRILIGAISLAVAGALGLATVIAVMVSYNFNFLNWME
jgi:hypothetical protein